MFDIGFLELVIIAIVGLLVMGPERLPGAIRTGGLWLARLKASFQNIKSDFEREINRGIAMRFSVWYIPGAIKLHTW